MCLPKESKLSNIEVNLKKNEKKKELTVSVRKWQWLSFFVFHRPYFKGGVIFCSLGFGDSITT